MNFVFVLALGQALPALPPEAPRRVLRVAVYDLRSDGIDTKVRKLVEAALLEELRKLRRVNVVGMDEIRRMLEFEEEKQLQGCEETSCLSDIAGALGVETMVTGSLARVGDQTLIGLKRVNQEKAEVVKAFTQRLTPAGGEEFLAVLGEAVQTLFPDVPLRDGEVRGVAPEIAALLNPPPLPIWAFVLGASAEAGVVAVGAFGYAVYGINLYLHESEIVRASGTGTYATTNDLLTTYTLLGTLGGGLGALCTVAALVGGTGLLATGFFVDWRGVRE